LKTVRQECLTYSHVSRPFLADYSHGAGLAQRKTRHPGTLDTAQEKHGKTRKETFLCCSVFCGQASESPLALMRRLQNLLQIR